MNRTPRPEGDGYAVEVSLLKPKAHVLALAAVCFVALVALLSWLGGGAQQQLAASKTGTNHAANQERRAEPSAIPNSATSSLARDEDKRAAASSEPASDADAVPGPSPAGFAENAAPDTTPAAPPAVPAAANDNAAPAASAVNQPSTAGSSTTPAVGGFAVQAGSFPSVSEANERVNALRAAGFEARTAAVELPRRGTWHRVYSGRFASREEAAAHDKKLRASGAVSDTLIAPVRD